MKISGQTSSSMSRPDCLDLTPETIERLSACKVLVIGDIMLDAYLMGDAERISPEAPVPVFQISGERQVLGGAGNVARNIAALGGFPTLVGTVGDDREADVLRRLLEEDSVRPVLHGLRNRPTTVKTRVMARRQQMIRLDREDVSPLAQAELESVLASVEDLLWEYPVVILSDYNKGLLSSPFMEGLSVLLQRPGSQPKVLVDPKPSNVGLYRDSFLMTPNTRETGDCAGLPVRNREEILAAGRAILARGHCRHLLTTLGADGMALFQANDEVWHVPTMARDVFDVTGAGDTVIATLALSLAAGVDLLSAAILANYAAGIVVAQVGAATASPERLREAMLQLPFPALSRWA